MVSMGIHQCWLISLLPLFCLAIIEESHAVKHKGGSPAFAPSLHLFKVASRGRTREAKGGSILRLSIMCEVEGGVQGDQSGGDDATCVRVCRYKKYFYDGV